MSLAAMGINLLVSWATGRSLESILAGVESKIKNPRKALEKAVKKICTKYNIEEKTLKEKSIDELHSLLNEEQWKELSLEFLEELSRSDREKKLSEILVENNIYLENVRDRIDALNLESLKIMMRSSTAAVSFYELPSGKDLIWELGAFELQYIERKHIEIENLKKKKRVVLVGKCGSGKSRLLFEMLKGEKNVVFVKRFFTGADAIGLNTLVRPLTDFVMVWDNLHLIKEEEIRKCLQRIEDLCREKGIDFRFIGASRREKTHYGSQIKEISLPDLRRMQLVKVCSKRYRKRIDRKVAKKLLEVGDGTPEYIISFFKLFKKEQITEGDLKDFSSELVSMWVDHIKDMDIKGTDAEKALRSVALSSRGFGGIVLKYVEDLYRNVFYGDMSHFDNSLRSLREMFFVEEVSDEEFSFHDSRAEAVEQEFPLKMSHLNRLIAMASKIREEIRRYLFRNYADWSYYSKKHKFCVRFCDCIIEIDPEDASAYSNRGNAYSSLNQFQDAIKNYTKAIEIDPEYASAYSNRGLAYSDLNQFQEAIKDYTKAVEIDPELAQAYYNRGLAYSDLNQFQQAINDYTKAIEIDPEDASAYSNRGNAYSSLNQFQDAIKDYTKAIEIDPELAQAYSNRGLAYSDLNQFQQAIKDYTKAVEIDPELAQAYSNRGLAYSDLNQFQQAINDYTKAIEIDPEYASAYSNRGNAYSSLNQFQDAIKDYTKAIKLQESLPDKGARVYLSLGDALEKVEKFEKAVDAFKTGGIVFLTLGDSRTSLTCFSRGFQLLEHVQNGNVIYCGLFLYIVLKDKKVKDVLQKIKIPDRTLKKIFMLALKKEKGESIENEIEALKKTIESPDLLLLLSLLEQS
jgi:tetratricopeptide (TPR) repeat protein